MCNEIKEVCTKLYENKMELTNILPHPLIEDCFIFQSEYGKQYMLEKIAGQTPELYWDQIYFKQGYVNLALSIKQVVVPDGRVFNITHYYESELEFLSLGQAKRFFQDMVTVIEYLVENNIFHHDLWDRHSIWLHDERYYVKPFKGVPSTTTAQDIISRCLRDIFILACNLILSLHEGATFTSLEGILLENPFAKRLIPLYKAIEKFRSFDDIYTVLVDMPSDANPYIILSGTVVMSDVPAIKIMQSAVLRATSLTDDS